MPFPVAIYGVSIVFAGDFHHQYSSLNRLVRYVLQLQRLGHTVIFVSSCQPWLSAAIERYTDCYSLRYVEITSDVHTAFDACMLGCSKNVLPGTCYEGCLEKSAYQPKRQIFRYSLLLRESSLASYHGRLSKVNWLELLLSQTNAYRVPTISGQVSPQVTYHFMFNKQVYTDVNPLQLTMLGISLSDEDKSLWNPLTADPLPCQLANIPGKAQVEESYNAYSAWEKRILNDPYYWKPGQTKYVLARMHQRQIIPLSRCHLLREIMILELLLALSQQYYIKDIRFSGCIPANHQPFLILASSFKACVTKSCCGIARVSVVIDLNRDQLQAYGGISFSLKLVPGEVERLRGQINNHYDLFRSRAYALP